MFFLGPTLEQDVFNEALNGLKLFDQELAKRGSPFFGGSKPGMLDFMIWPWCERADVIRIIWGEQFVIPRERFLRLVIHIYTYMILADNVQYSKWIII